MGEVKGLIEQYCASSQKNMIQIAHLAFLLIVWATCVGNMIKILSKN